MVTLNLIHYTYIAMVITIIVIMCFKKDVVLPCIMGLGIIGYVWTGNILKSVQIIYKAIVVSGKEFIEIIIIISLVNAMSKSLKQIGADELMIKPLKKFMTNKTRAFFTLGFTMMIFSWFIWPTPAVAFIGAIMLPAAISAGLSPIWAAVSIDIFGNGAALSSDYFIQAAPSITAKTSELSSPFDVIKGSIILWSVMTLVTITTSFILMKKESKLNSTEVNVKTEKLEAFKGAKFIAILTPVVFLLDLILMYKYKLKGGDATALIGGSAVIIMSIASITRFKLKKALGEVTGNIRDGFVFGMKVFAPIIIIGAFFFLGSNETARVVFGSKDRGILNDIGVYLSNKVPLSKVSIILIHTLISGMLGVGGSGFSGLPLIGTLAQVFSSSIEIDKAGLAALGQIVTIWIGGGTIIPWSVVPIAAVCDVQPFDLVKKNIIPVTVGIMAMIITAMFIL